MTEPCRYAWGRCSNGGRPHLCKLDHDHEAPAISTPHRCRFCNARRGNLAPRADYDQARISYRFIDGTAPPWEA